MTEIREYALTKELTIQVKIDQNPLQLDADRLFKLAARLNKKRSFLFVSPILGKHLPVNPSIALLVGRALALLYAGKRVSEYQQIRAVLNDTEKQRNWQFDQEALPLIEQEEPLTVIGFCETATALGQAFFESFATNAKYVHTTREELLTQQPLLSFEEEHSHATAHRVYAADPNFFNDTSEVILVDDEVTTGKTNLNIIRDLIQSYPQKKKFTIVSILDWRNNEQRQAYRALEKEKGIAIQEVSLLQGTVNEVGQVGQLPEDSLIQASTLKAGVLQPSAKGPKFGTFDSAATPQTVLPPYLLGTGRFGLTTRAYDEQPLQQLAALLQGLRHMGPALVLGTGEFMYLPMRLASLMGPDVYFHTTTRSPILSKPSAAYPILDKRQFSSPEQPNVVNYVYGIGNENRYQDIFVIFERIVDLTGLQQLHQHLGTIQDTQLYLVDLTAQVVYHSIKGGQED